MKYYLAIDIGASSGRHIIGYKVKNEIKTETDTKNDIKTETSEKTEITEKEESKPENSKTSDENNNE